MPALEFSPVYHPFFEVVAYFVGFRYFLKRRGAQTQTELSQNVWMWLAVGAILGAALGSKIVFWIQDPAGLGGRLPHLHAWMGGKTVVGGFLGGVIGVEWTKKIHGIQQATGDVFVTPMMVALMIGRLGCFAAGLADRTYGVPTQLPWGVDFGDGLARHPTQLYEIGFLAVFWLILRKVGPLPRAGDRFKLWMASYLAFRFLVEFIKPMPFRYFGALSGIQLACLTGWIYYGPHVFRILFNRDVHGQD